MEFVARAVKEHPCGPDMYRLDAICLVKKPKSVTKPGVCPSKLITHWLGNRGQRLLWRHLREMPLTSYIKPKIRSTLSIKCKAAACTLGNSPALRRTAEQFSTFNPVELQRDDIDDVVSTIIDNGRWKRSRPSGKLTWLCRDQNLSSSSPHQRCSIQISYHMVNR
jgi:hypothetical protein